MTRAVRFAISPVSFTEFHTAAGAARPGACRRNPRRYAPSIFSGRTGPSTTRCPCRRTRRISGRPWDDAMRSRIWVGLTLRPSIATMRSPAWRPTFAAGVSDCTWPTFPVSLPPESMNRIVKSTRASRRFVLEPAAERRGKREELRPLGDRPSEVHVHVRGGRTVHPGDLHVAAEGDRAEAVLDPLPVPLHERRREADVEAARIHPHRPGGEEVAGLVDEDEEAEA